MSTPIPPELEQGLAKEDPIAVARAIDLDEMQRLIAAEELLKKRYNRLKRTGRTAKLAQALVGYVALAGFFANAYQNYNSKKQAEERARTDEERWAKEFKRSQDADKYRAFFETSALATDKQNPDKRMVGYALLREFVSDHDYNSKATLLLEESLALELRDEQGPGIDEMHRATVVAILSALSHTSDCHSLAHAARSVDRLARKHSREHDIEESREVLGLYILRIVGRAAEVCSPKEFLEIRRPIRELMTVQPEIAALPAHSTRDRADARIREILLSRCQEEITAGIAECAQLPAAWTKLCETLSRNKDSAALCSPQTSPGL